LADLDRIQGTGAEAAGGPRLKALVVDDEPLARLRLKSLLAEQRRPAVEVLGEAESAQQALALLTTLAPDVVLLDIRMPGRDGLQLAQALRTLPVPPAVVFVTAHGHHALRAFELDAVDYLTKPVARARLHEALQRVWARRPTALAAQDGGAAANPAAAAAVLVVAERGRVLRIPVAEVLVLKAEMKYVPLRTAPSSHVLDDSLTELEHKLGPGFIRIHRNALVAVAAVRELKKRPTDDRASEDRAPGHGEASAEEGWAVRVAPLDEWLPVSRRQVAAVREALAL
jgi:two-component system, LytTR family, response regulator AlgR